ncbi:23S rRNA (guanosine(2251)-2'-O)-methyltransferase RlmB [Enterococcus durans]|uniref:23S rRNA (guanosine(2251)-2'-O)-methyltransferase RlmB n=1 Tax=Enterococcus sp. VV15 TaxID=2233541 RepID=UPI000CF0CEDB|nr:MULTISPECIES: 23S rRNA (guanosine(2251)-2'-O)-methyltransferase RlmB [Enterococcus]PQD34507.1 23S rRNA (guanosine(2251)-2'-O)-methyltransferase RlmB [Enterococcus durans]TKN19608.1 23S rRNA (guanosine(2251)-2'-O)-methyltransferase RlmB [Enterococcus sp. VV15]HJG22764.1 23S rRNA (guanosine(2251)-2'-O)-methyltransferase RlmB [Enterococcus durans]
MSREKNERNYTKRNKKSQQKSPKFVQNKANRPESVMKSAEEEPLEDNFIFGHHASVEALQQGRGNKLFLQEDARGEKIDELKTIAREQSVPVKWVPKQKLDTLSDHGVHQGIVLAITPYEYLSLDQLLIQAKEKTETPFFLILDSIEDPHNFGSILRTADASGVDGVIIPKHRAVGITPIVTKTSTGAVEHVLVARVTNLVQTVQQLKEEGFWVFGTDMDGTNFQKWNAQGSIALVIGNEGRGMSPGLKKEMDELLTIPMIGHVQSLNASVAAGLLMYQAFSQRQGE